MSEFDYAKAWRDAARPMFEALPPDILALVQRTGEASAHLHQLPDLSMQWPDDSGTLRGFFDRAAAVDAGESLALAARVVYSCGHWYPGDGPRSQHWTRPTGVDWKFANYADQVLRGLLKQPERERGHTQRGWSQAVHQGAIRVCWSSDDMWTWEEVAPATPAGRERLLAELWPKLNAATSAIGRAKYDRDTAAYRIVEDLRAQGSGLWPASWLPIIETKRYYVEARDAVEVLPEEGTANLAAERAEILKRASDTITKAEATRAAMLWLNDHGLSTDNALYYDHTRILRFGWRDPVSKAAESAILDVISEYPGAYEIKCRDGRTLSNAEADMAKAARG